MPEVEFLVPDDIPHDAAPPAAPGEEIEQARGPARIARPQLLGALAAALWAAGATVAVIAPFHAVLRVKLPSSNFGGFVMDGWGRLRLDNGAGAPTQGHTDRYGIPLAVCAGVLAIAALLGVVTAWGAPVWADSRAGRLLHCRILPGLALLAGGTAVGIGSAGLLTLSSERDALAVSFTADGESIPDVVGGTFPWLAFLAAACAVLGAVAAAVSHGDDPSGDLDGWPDDVDDGDVDEYYETGGVVFADKAGDLEGEPLYVAESAPPDVGAEELLGPRT